MFMRICPNNTQTIILKHIKNHENFIENLSQMSPNSLKNLLNSILGSFWDVFGARGQVGSTALPVNWGTRLLAPFWAKMVPKGAILGTPLNPKWLQNRTVEDRSALRPSKNDLWKGVRKKHENSMKKRCKNRRFLMAQNHVWRYTLRL